MDKKIYNSRSPEISILNLMYYLSVIGVGEYNYVPLTDRIRLVTRLKAKLA